ncbi:glycoside hydrolase family 38 C-terminal domain-containing protein [Companilactobacillus bobalius]|uniref:Mannosylglycerate hydrolase n=2 Tax=Companilactobacillus bobalius TaxID=2801451 RepID=A0A202FAQ0_9LACO|nr:glycoside hydrolase family 38 C-terminal domain-containing protein [Companilactobacillus bobalius]KAE9562492.1 alpha-mannosidase [Companilactobacillus bobalius]KRK81481.1 alpha-mannosidase [Companilactobacillus bobalius DSM 19674]OVE97554.1 Mannosylglycerate hydrolase [Companilactobacillus bobalius]GEO57835.1 alpha-mannosidase [Companilactobacillus paralimentarius]
MVKTVHVFPHTHWDREWYFTTSRSKVYLLKDLMHVIDNLQHNTGYDRFILDGQASLVEDYLKWRPQDKNVIKQLVADKKLIIGPWYTQTDQFVISGESIVRNLQYGMDVCNKLGTYMNVGYVPDSFGQESSMPQIYKGFGIPDTMFWRGVSEENVNHTEFVWKGEDGSKVNVYQIPSGYYIGGVVDETQLDKIMHQEPFASIVKRSTTSHIAFPNGFDQAPARKDLPELIKKLNDANKDFHFEVSSIQEYIDAVKSEKPELEEVSGEFTNGKNMRIHKSIYSSRSDLKKLNTKIQYYIVNVLEPVLTMGEHYGVDYPREAVNDIWKLMFENAAHDSIGSCVSDTTNEDVYMRYKQVRDISTNLVEVTLREIATQIKKNKKYEISLSVFNTLPVDRTEITKVSFYAPSQDFEIVDENDQSVDFSIESCEDQTEYIAGQTIQLNPGEKIYKPEKIYKVVASIFAKDVPAMGYKQLYINENAKKNEVIKAVDDRILENDNFKIVIQDNGSLTITDKASGKVYENQAILEENGDDGDSFNYSPAKKDLIVYSTDQANTISVTKSDLVSLAKIDYDFSVPENLDDRAKKICNVKMPVSVEIRLEKDSSVIKFNVKIDNRGPLDHRLCIDFATGISSKVSYADQQFGTIKRPVYREKEMKSWAANKENWNEKPISIETCQSFVALSNKENTVSVFPKGVREYEIIGKDYSTIRLTLFRTYGMMGKVDLLYRPGRASGEKVIATPNAELQSELSFELGLSITNKGFDDSEVASKAKNYDTPEQYYEYADFLNGRLIFNMDSVDRTLDENGSILHTKGNLILSTLKKADHRSGYIARFYNGYGDKATDDRIVFNKKPNRVELVDLKEDTIKKLPIVDNTVKLNDITHAKIKTIYFEY